MSVSKSGGRVIAGVAALTVAKTVAISAPASATVVSVGGGTWDYGASATDVWSYYNHASKTHKSSVVNSRGTKTSGWKVKGVQSLASQQASLTGNHAYWDTK